MEKKNNYELMKHKAQAEFASHDLDAMREEWQLESAGEALTLIFLGQQYWIDRHSGAVLWNFDGTMREADYNVCMTLYDILTRPCQQASGEMLAISALSSIHSATVPARSFFDQTAKRFEHRCADLSAACKCLGGVPYGRGDVSFLLPIFRDICVAVRFWDSDEEFGPEFSFLCDGNILRFMHYETMMFLLCHVAERLTELADKSNQQ